MVVFALPLRAGPLACKSCHPKEVEGYSHYSMAHSLRQAEQEPVGSFENQFGTKFTIYSNEFGTWQRMQNAEGTSEYRVEYVIGSGRHAQGYLVRIGDHLFQSPIGYYPSRHGYGMAPGFEKYADADFTRPITVACLLCHSGKTLHKAGTTAGYETPAFSQEAISCERCHGPTEAHLKHPVPGSIVNPAKLQGAARDSVCEQCHLAGVARITNPGKTIEDFHPGIPLEDVFSVYVSPESPGSSLRVISQSEELRASACARNSNGKFWCGTCHDPHNKPAFPAVYYRARCLGCHAAKLGRAHPKENSDCVSCHMPRRPTVDGAHTVFTDHRIQRVPSAEPETASSRGESSPDLVAWREPAPEFAPRNLAIAYIEAGSRRNSPAWIIKGYRMLTEVQTAFGKDSAVFSAFGTALLQGNQPREAKIAFDRALELDPSQATNYEDAGRADLACGDLQGAETRLEEALKRDPLLLSSIHLLDLVYEKQGEAAKRAALAEQVQRMIGNGIRSH